VKNRFQNLPFKFNLQRYKEDPKLAAAMAMNDDTAGNATTTTKLSFVRADVGRLPFATGSLDAVHAGAAMHCWPSPSAAVAEISRVLKPGGVFAASTFLDPTAMLVGLRSLPDVRLVTRSIMAVISRCSDCNVTW
jgi:ubiquinone/menaquinone biosynthesis C-methylase UbiE